MDSGVRRIIALQSHPAVRSVTAVLGPQNGDFYGLCEEYDREMARHAKALADEGVVIDPWPLLLATTREDGYHMENNDVNTRMCVTFYKALIRGNSACRQVWHHRAHLFAANDRSVVFNRVTATSGLAWSSANSISRRAPTWSSLRSDSKQLLYNDARKRKSLSPGSHRAGGDEDSPRRLGRDRCGPRPRVPRPGGRREECHGGQ